MKHSLIAFSFLIVTTGLIAQPTWIDFESRTSNFPEDQFLVGYSSELLPLNGSKEDLLEKLANYAKERLVQNVISDIKSNTTMNIHNVNGNTLEELKSSSVSSSYATIAGLKIETYFGGKKKRAAGYAFAYAAKVEVIQYYQNAIRSFVSRFNTEFEISLLALTRSCVDIPLGSLVSVSIST